MKVRSGFVSNSSTSSFIVVGVLVDENDERFSQKNIAEKLLGMDTSVEYWEDDYYDKVWNADVAILCGPDDGIEDGKVLIGKQIADISDDDCLDFFEDDIESNIGVIKEALSKLGFTEEVKVKIYGGTRSC